MEEQIILWLQSHSSAFLDIFLKGVSHIASWLGTTCVLLIIFFFVNKKFALFFGAGFLSTVGINFALKEIISRPRPYIANPEIINKLTTIGKSFPSGHSVSVMFMVLMLLYLFSLLQKQGKFKQYGKKWLKVLCVALGVMFIILTAISRMYLGQHYLSDIFAGLTVGALGFCATYFVSRKKLVKKQQE